MEAKPMKDRIQMFDAQLKKRGDRFPVSSF